MAYGRGAAAVKAVEEVSLEIAHGEFIAVVGPSGCGKSSLMKLIAGLHAPASGSLSVDGKPIAGPLKSVGMAFQNSNLLPWRTAIRNVEFALEAGSVGKKERAQRALQVLQLVELESFEQAFPYQLSGGMRSRVALARSLVTEPRILLMDEPFSRLDAQTRGLMHEELLRVYQLKRMTVVFVTHDVAEAVLLADQVAVMSPRPGTIREVVDITPARPRDITQPEVASYMQRLRRLV